MATKDELIGGLQMVIQEGKRIGEAFGDEQWTTVQDFDGWKNREVLAHVASIGGIVVPFVTAMANAPAGADASTGMDVDTLNAQLVGQRAGKSAGELVGEIETSYGQVIEWVRSADDATLKQRATFGGYKDLPLSDMLVRLVVLHGLAHIYSAYAATLGLPTGAAKATA